jgi:hypothetical protein
MQCDDDDARLAAAGQGRRPEHLDQGRVDALAHVQLLMSANTSFGFGARLCVLNSRLLFESKEWLALCVRT